MNTPVTQNKDLLDRIDFMAAFYSLKKKGEYVFDRAAVLLCGLFMTDTHVCAADRNKAHVYLFDRQLTLNGLFDLSKYGAKKMPVLADVGIIGNVLLVSDIGNRDIYKIELAGSCPETFFSANSSSMLDAHFTMCAGTDGLYVLNIDEKRIYLLNGHGQIIKKGITLTKGPDDLNRLFFSVSDKRLFAGSIKGEVWEVDDQTFDLKSLTTRIENFCDVKRVTDFSVSGSVLYFVDAKAGRLIKTHGSGAYCYWECQEADLIRLCSFNDFLVTSSAPGQNDFGGLHAFDA